MESPLRYGGRNVRRLILLMRNCTFLMAQLEKHKPSKKQKYKIYRYAYQLHILKKELVYHNHGTGL